MILRLARGALLTAALFVGACQTGFYQSSAPPPPQAMTPMDGMWSSTDGVFVAQFDAGRFTSRFTATNEILAQGSYNVAGNIVTMQWTSVATQQRRSATCTINTRDTVTCNQDGGGNFQLARNTPGFNPPAAEPFAAAAPAPPAGPAPAPVQ